MDQPKWVAHAGLRNLTSIYDWLEFNWFLILLKELIILCGQQGIPTEESYYLVLFFRENTSWFNYDNRGKK